MKKIGLLGGIGPEATGEFYLSLIRSIQILGITSNEEFPQIIINSIPGVELKKGFNENKLTTYIEGIMLLDQSNVDFIAIVCNTAYTFYDILSQHTKKKILHIGTITQKHLPTGNQVILLGTDLLIASGVFQGIDYIQMSGEEENTITRIIYDFNRKGFDDHDALIIKDIIDKYGTEGTVILSACSEISLILKNQGIPFYDTMEFLKQEILELL